MATHQASGSPLRAVAIRCDGCGATFGVLPTAGQAHCPYCQRAQLVSPQMLAQLEQYERAVQVEVAQTEAAQDRAAAGRTFRNRYPKRRTKYIAEAVLGGQFFGAALFLSATLFHFPSQQTAIVICGVGLGLTVALLLWIRHPAATKPRASSAVEPRSLRVACANCGAVADMALGAAAHRCAYCQTAIVASQVVIQQGASVAASAHRQARLEELRESRRVAAAVNSVDSSNAPYFIGALFVLVCLGKAIRTVVAAQRGEAIDELDDFYLPAAATPVLIVGLLALFFFRRSRRSRCRSAVQVLFAPYSSIEIETREALADWLNRHWPVAYEMYRLDFGRYFLCAHATVAAYPVLLRGNLWPVLGVELPALHLLLAAQSHAPEGVPSAANRAPGQAIARFAALGFELELSEAGLLAIASPAKVDSLRRLPRELSELGPVLQALVEVAASVGAVPG